MSRGALLFIWLAFGGCGGSHTDDLSVDAALGDGDAGHDAMTDSDADAAMARETGPADATPADSTAPDAPDDCVDETAVNQCTNASDMGILIDPMTGMQRAAHGATMNKKASDVAADCARDCYFAGSSCYLADACTRNAAVNACVREGVAGLSEGCSSCFVRSLICSVDHCLAPCAGSPTSTGCVQCRCDNHCFDVFTECSGLATDALCPG